MADPLASPRPHLEERKSFMPKQPVELDPPKDDPITYEQLKENDGTSRVYSIAGREIQRKEAENVFHYRF
jgi:hypothetical protein